MKKLIYILIIKALLYTSAHAQQETENIAGKHAASIDSLFANAGIGRQHIETGILYERALPFAALHRFEQTDTVNKSYFMQAAMELRNAAYDTLQHLRTSEMRRIANQYTYRENLVPIGVLFNELTHMDTMVFKKGLIDVDKQGQIKFGENFMKEGLVNKTVLISAVLSSKSEFEPEVSFVLVEELMTGNKTNNIRSIKIDFGDGAGFRNIKPGEVVDINYSSYGKKPIILHTTTDNEDNFKSISTIKVREEEEAQFGKYDEIPEQYRQVEIEADIAYPYFDVETMDFVPLTGKGRATYLHRFGNNLQKPVLVVNGFDPENKINDLRLFNQYLNSDTLDNKFKFADELYDAGYDIVILDFHPKEAGPFYVDHIQRNGYVVMKLIEEINQELSDNGSNEELVVVGASMGGLVTRYALTRMEQMNKDHNTRLWITLDSPHNGANIPIGLQHFIDIFATISSDAEKKREIYFDKNPAAKQMLIDYFGEGTQEVSHNWLRNGLINDFDGLGFPQQSRNIAISNGSLNGTVIQTPSSNALNIKVRLDWWPTPPLLLDATIRSTASYSSNSEVFKMNRLNPCKPWVFQHFPTTCAAWNTFVAIHGPHINNRNATALPNSYSLDNAPGGYRTTYGDIPEEMNGDLPMLYNWYIPQPTHSFISTKSALAFSGDDPDLRENIRNRNLVSTGETPFDSYWAPVGKNMEHATLFDEELMGWLLNEINGIKMPPTVDYIIKGPSTVYNHATYFVDNLPPQSFVLWQWHPESAFIRTNNDGDLNTTELKVAAQNVVLNNVIITATIHNINWDETVIANKYGINVRGVDSDPGFPDPDPDPENPLTTPTILGPYVWFDGGEYEVNCLYPGQQATMRAMPENGVDSYHWVLYGGTYPELLGNQQTTQPFTLYNTSNSYYIEAKQHHVGGGWSAISTKLLGFCPGSRELFSGYSFKSYPNPVRNTLYVDISIDDESQISEFLPDNPLLTVQL